MEKWQKNAVRLVAELALGDREDPSVVRFSPEKTEVLRPGGTPLPRRAPEKQGVSSRRIAKLLADLEAEPRANIQNLMILRGGAVIAECSRPGCDRQTPRLSHSMSKTLTGMAIGLLMDDGRLSPEDPALNFFPNVLPKDERARAITVGDLLAMSAGIRFGEVGAVTEADWTAAYFASEMKFAPSEGFLYNSMNTYLLSRIAAQVGGESLSSLVSRRLFAPMGIGSFFWERSPEGYEKGGWGLYLSCEDWAKLGLLMERGGRWNGAQLLSEEFVRQATSIRNPASTVQKKHFAYGWQLWVDKRENGDFLFNGMLGQNVLVSPAADLVISMASANNEIFQDSPSLELILSFADEMRSGIGAPRHDREGVRLLRERENSFFSARAEAHPLPRGKKPPLLRALPFLGRFFGREEPIPPVYRPFIGKKLLVGHSTIGALPLFVRLLDNNLAGRLNALYLREDGERLLLDLTEGGKEQTIPVGLRGYAEGTLEKNGERYLVRTLAEAEYAPPPLPSGGEDGKTAGGVSRLRIEIVFPELPATHTLVLTEEDGEILLANRETPGSGIADSFLLKLRERKDRLSSLLALLERKYGAGFPERLLAALFEPQVVCVDARDERREEKLAARRAAEEKKISFLRKLFGLFTLIYGEGEEDDRSFFARLFAHAGRPKAAKEKTPAAPESEAEALERIYELLPDGGRDPIEAALPR